MEEKQLPFQKVLMICANEREAGKDACGNRGAQELVNAMKDAVKKAGLKGKVQVAKTGCLGFCSIGPNAMLFPDNRLMHGVKTEDLPELARRLGFDYAACAAPPVTPPATHA